MKRQLLLWLGLSLAALSFIPAAASAHILQADGEIGAVLHINPDDNPLSGQPTSYILTFTDTSHRFTLEACACTAALTANGQTVLSQPLIATSPLQSNNPATFPRPAAYTLTITGRPQQPGVFQPFQLSYLVRVEGSNRQPTFPPLLALGFGLSMGLILLAVYAADRPAPTRHKEKK